jgi:hypothetical protein
MGIFEDANVSLVLADYIGVDSSGKLNALGVGFTATGIQANGMTPSVYIAALIDLPSKYVGQEFAVSLKLQNDDTGQVVTLTGPTGQPDALRLQQVFKAERAVAPPGAYLPEGMFCRTQMLMAFPNGLPLAPSSFFSWVVEIDGNSNSSWRCSFYVIGPPPGPVFGGPAGPTDIPSFPPIGKS